MSLLKKEDVEKFYDNYKNKLRGVRFKLNRPLTYTEKILFTHLIDRLDEILEITRGITDIPLKIDRVAMQDATAQMAILQFMLAGKKKVEVPTTIHCDHLIQAKVNADYDLQQAILGNNEVYQFLKSAANKYGMGFWKPGSGIIHQVILENYAIPGQLMIGTDSHTPNAGGLGMAAIGIGGADAVDAMTGEAWKLRMPKMIGVHLKGKLNGWAAPKDVILKLAEILTVKGGTGHIIEYFGKGTKEISVTGKATITNMGAELGATTSIFPYDDKSSSYLRSTQRGFAAEMADLIKDNLKADPEVEENPHNFFDEVVTINLDSLEPHVAGPHTPDLVRPISKLSSDVINNHWPVELSAALIGSCTNSSYEDMSRAAEVAKQAADKNLQVKAPFMITPGSEQIYQTMKRDGLLQVFEKIGGKVLANACGPCIGQWERKNAGRNSILTSYNRNFKKRNDANPETHAFISSPEIVTAMALAGRLDFNPLKDEIDGLKLEISPGNEIPPQGFVFDVSGYHEPDGKGDVTVDKNSDRLALLQPFKKLENFNDMFVLVKTKGKCTTDHISPAGKWLAYRGHLDKISGNLYSGAVNFFTGEVGKGKNLLTNETEEFSAIARRYKEEGKGWVVVGDENYGEGSSREHAAMEPRFLGCSVIIAKSFARIAETNLKKQGLLPLWFADKEDYEKIKEDNLVSVEDYNLQVNKPVYLTVKHSDGSMDAIKTNHTLSAHEIKWFEHGSALNWVRFRGLVIYNPFHAKNLLKT